MLRKSLTFFGIATFCLLVYLFFQFIQYQQKTHTAIIENGHQISTDLERQITDVLHSIEQETYAFANFLANSALSKKELEREIKALATKTPALAGVTVAYEPFSYAEDVHLYAPYFDKAQNRFLYIEEVYDYTDKKLDTAQWYTGVRDGGSTWVEPYFAEGAQALVTDFGVPLYRNTVDESAESERTLIGTVTLTISLKQFNAFIRTLTIGKTGEALVLSGENRILAHSNGSLVRDTFTADMLSSAPVETTNDLLSGQAGVVKYTHKSKQDTAYFFHQPVKHNNWKLGLLLFKQDQSGDGRTVKRKLIQISVVLCILLFILLAIYFNRDYLSTGEAWVLSVFASLIFLANTIFVGMLQHKANYTTTNKGGPPITTPAQIENIAQTTKLSQIPLGIQVQQMEFKNAYNLNIGGVIWTITPNDAAEPKELRVHFSQLSPFAESFHIEKVYQQQTSSGHYTRYEFRATLLLKFDYSHFPFDKRHIAIGLVPGDPETMGYFVPDLSSYASANLSALPGLDQQVHLPGNHIMRSYFSFVEYDNFKVPSQTQLFETNSPQLQFNIDVKRILINAFVSYLIPILVSLMMMFILLYATRKPLQSEGYSGGIVEGMAAFFFVLVFSHIDMRKSIETPELMYMEYFYFIAYIMVAMTTMNLILFTRSNTKVFDFKDNLIMKLAFWPLFLFLSFTVTLIKFY